MRMLRKQDRYISGSAAGKGHHSKDIQRISGRDTSFFPVSGGAGTLRAGAVLSGVPSEKGDTKTP